MLKLSKLHCCQRQWFYEQLQVLSCLELLDLDPLVSIPPEPL